MNKSPLRIGIVGGGWVATNRHIPAFMSDKRVEVQAIVDKDLDKARAVAQRFGIPQAYGNLPALWRGQVDAVSICTPPWLHAPMIQSALEAGKHVLVEKPMTLKSTEGRFLEQMARQKNLILCPCHNFLFSRSARKADSLLNSGRAGEVKWAMGLQISSDRRRLPDWYRELPGGLFFDEAPHLLYLTRHFMGEVRVEQAWQGGERFEVRLQGQHPAYLTMWFGAPFSEWLFILFCSRAVLVIDLFRDILMQLPEERGHSALDVLKTSMRGTLQFWGGAAASGGQAALGRLLYGHDILARRFVDAIIDHRESPVAAGEGWRVIGLIEEILARSGHGAGPA